MQETGQHTHDPVMVDETVAGLNAQSGGLFVDATLGLGGHSERILEASEGSRVIGIDQDRQAIAAATEKLKRFGKRFTAVHSNFSGLRIVLAEQGVEVVDGIVADLGVSSLQFDSEERGFSFRFDSSLDMRMDPDSGGQTAADLLMSLSEEEIANLIYQFGEERASRKIAKRIVERREAGEPITTTGQLARLVKGAVGQKPGDKLHPATRTFQALRIAVNNELQVIEPFLRDAVEALRIEGRLAVITFHSLEDRIVKTSFQRFNGKCICPPRIPECRCGAKTIAKILTKKPIVPTAGEVNENPRSRSAKLRILEKI